MSDYKSAKAISSVKGFTLVELLVVISIIALLLAILMPALNKAREAGKRAVCLSNVKSLAVTWMVYAGDNGDRLVNAMASPLQQIGTNKFRWHTTNALFLSYFHGPSWVGWWDDKSNIAAQKEAIKIGTLYPYNKSLDLYHCPTSKRGEIRTYSIGDSMNGYDGWAGVGGKTLTRLSAVPRPSDRMVFIDEGYASRESWSLSPNTESWWDAVPLRHSNGTTLSFADGHSSYRKWVDKRTIEFAKIVDAAPSLYNPPSHAQADNPDLEYMQMALWGHNNKP